MPTRPGFQPYGGSRLRLARRKMVASVQIFLGDALKNTSNAATLDVAASNDRVRAVYMDADRLSTDADYALTPYRSVMLTDGDMQWFAVREAGTLTEADVGNTCDLNSADGLAVDTDTNHDVTIEQYIDANTCIVRFNKTVPTGL